MKTQCTYPAKLLLFGEYTVLNGSRALAVPMPLWKGSLKNGGTQPDERLLKLCQYFEDKEMFAPEDRHTLRTAVEEGLYFDSDIPQGYGLGSSGALCAALYTEYFDKGDYPTTLELKHILSSMEAYFHGTSSGMDPLVSLMQAPVLREHNSYHILPPLQWSDQLQVFLLDSGLPRATGSLVEQYIQWSTREDYRLECIRPLVKSVDHAISFFLEGYIPGFWEHLRMISFLQQQYFTPMITDKISALWQSIQNHPDVILKLCGAGGGGYYLGFAKADTEVKSILGGTMHIIPVSVPE